MVHRDINFVSIFCISKINYSTLSLKVLDESRVYCSRGGAEYVMKKSNNSTILLHIMHMLLCLDSIMNACA
jgi:hypothetical protein